MSDNSLQFWETIGVAFGVITGICTTTYGIFRKVYCRGKDDTSRDDKIKYLEKQILDQASELSALKEDIAAYRSEQKKLNETILENQSEIKQNLSYIRGKLDEQSNR